MDSQIRQRYKGGRQRQSLAGQRRSIKSQTHTGRKAGTPTQGSKTERHWGARAQRLKTLGVNETSQLVAGSWWVANVTPCANRKFQAGQTSNNKSTSVSCTDDWASFYELSVTWICEINPGFWTCSVPGNYTHAAKSHLKGKFYTCWRPTSVEKCKLQVSFPFQTEKVIKVKFSFTEVMFARLLINDGNSAAQLMFFSVLFSLWHLSSGTFFF